MKGFIFTLDAAIALFFALALTAAVSGFLLTSAAGPAADVSLQQLAQDVLTVMDKNGTLKGMLPAAGGNTTAYAFLTSVLPADAGARINVTVYAYKGDSCPSDYCNAVCGGCSSATGFCACKNFTVSIGSVPSSGVAAAQRFFTDSSINKFGLATIEVWWK